MISKKIKELDVKLSYKCNNNCVFCLNKDKRESESSFEVIKKTVDLFGQNNGDKLVISGGEPLISKNLFELLAFAKSRNIRIIEIQTNARMLYYEDMVKRLKEFDPITFLVSFQFPNNKLYKKYSGTENGFNQTVQGIKNLIKHKLSFFINTVVMKPNLAYLEEMIKILKKIGVKKYQYRFIDGRNVFDNYKKFVPRYCESTPIVENIIEKNKDITIFLREFPFCVLKKGIRNKIYLSLDLERINLTAQNNLLTNNEIQSDQFVFPNCNNCFYFKRGCSGIRKEYAKVYGIKEIKPIVNKES
jgi:MoaA/NifB/PqqE/SkfB family radical SAM enzyme